MTLKKWDQTVSVIIPTYNRLALLQRAVKSVLSQCYSHLEIIIVNDGSSDSTKSYLERQAQSDRRFQIINHISPKGACEARNSGIFRAKGKYITFLDDDDEWTNDRVELLLKAFDPDQYSFICSAYWMITMKGKKKYHFKSERIGHTDMLWANIVGNSVLTLTERAQAIGGFDTGFTSAQDYDFFTRLLKRYGTGKRIEQPTIIQHTEHNNARISTAGAKRLCGQLLFYRRHAADMTYSQRLYYKYMYRRLHKGERRWLKLLEASPDIPFVLLRREVLHFMKKMIMS